MGIFLGTLIRGRCWRLNLFDGLNLEGPLVKSPLFKDAVRRLAEDNLRHEYTVSHHPPKDMDQSED
jgi:hypothetical protein